MLLENGAGGLLMGLPGPLICKKAVSVKLCPAKRDKTSVSLWITLGPPAALAAIRPVPCSGPRRGWGWARREHAEVRAAAAGSSGPDTSVFHSKYALN